MTNDTTTKTPKQRRFLRRAAWIAGGLVVALVVFLVAARVVGFEPAPSGRERPGLWLTGELVTEPVTDWSFAKDVPMTETAVEVNWRFFPILPHSVRTGRVHHKGRLYYGTAYPGGIEFGAGRQWNLDVARDPRARIKIGDKLYDVKFVPVTDPIERLEVLKQWGQAIWEPGMYMFLWRVDPRDNR